MSEKLTAMVNFGQTDGTFGIGFDLKTGEKYKEVKNVKIQSNPLSHSMTKTK